jgi:xanthine dehydrogenase accessory factor
MEESRSFREVFVQVKGAGDLGTGCALRLHGAGFPVFVTELSQPRVVRLGAALALAVFEGGCEVEGVVGVRRDPGDDLDIAVDLASGRVPVVVHEGPGPPSRLVPEVVVDAVMAKRNTGMQIDDAEVVVALGPGFTAGEDCHAVVETLRGHNLGRVLYEGSAAPDTREPGEIGGRTLQRLLRSPRDGVLRSRRSIGDAVSEGEVVAEIEGEPVRAALDGVLRGMIRDGLPVREGQKVGDVDPRGDREACFTVSDRSRAVAGGVLEAALHLLGERGLL